MSLRPPQTIYQETPITRFKKKKDKQSWETSSVVEHLPSRDNILGSLSSTVDDLLCIVYTHLHTLICHWVLNPFSCFTIVCKVHPLFPTSPNHLRGWASDGDKESHKWLSLVNKATRNWRPKGKWKQIKLRCGIQWLQNPNSGYLQAYELGHSA